MVWQGKAAVKTGRFMLGTVSAISSTGSTYGFLKFCQLFQTNPLDSPPGSIRGDYCIDVGKVI
jgi:nucleoside-diphosphate kinase